MFCKSGNTNFIFFLLNTVFFTTMGIITPIIVVVVILCALGLCKKIRENKKSDYLEEDRVSRDFVSGINETDFETREHHHREPASRVHPRESESRVHPRESEFRAHPRESEPKAFGWCTRKTLKQD